MTTPTKKIYKRKTKQVACCKKWVFTDYNVSQERQDAWRAKFNDKTLTKLAFQEEVCPTTQRRHLQGCLEFKKKARVSTLLSDLPHAPSFSQSQ